MTREQIMWAALRMLSADDGQWYAQILNAVVDQDEDGDGRLDDAPVRDGESVPGSLTLFHASVPGVAILREEDAADTVLSTDTKARNQLRVAQEAGKGDNGHMEG